MKILENGTIAIEEMKFFAYHGYYEEEREKGNHFEVDLYVKCNLSSSGKSDSLTETVNYEELYKIVETVMSKSYKLLEHIGWDILETIDAQFRNIHHAKVRVTKLNPPIQGDVKRVSIELESSANED